MNTLAAARTLGEMLEKTQVLYLRTEPEVLDFTINTPGKIVISGGQRVELEIARETAAEIAGFLSSSIFDKDNVSMLVCWNIKSLFSYLAHYVPSQITPSTSILDLQVIENFLGVQKNRPENFTEAVNRLKVAALNKNWKVIYKSLHLPLILQVLPALETFPLLDEQDRTSKYSYYEVEGQINGRLKCLKKFSRCYVPHTLGPEQKGVLRPRGYDLIFMTSDIKHCEVTVLQWLSKDENLGEIINLDRDLYSEIYRIITRDDCSSDAKRKYGKDIFLKAIYGIGAKSLAASLNVPVDIGRELIGRIKHEFPVAFGWLDAKQNEAKQNGLIEDYFGRPRAFTQEESYMARNFAVQGVAATICLEKLVDLYKMFKDRKTKLCFSIHDGYGFVGPKSEAAENYRIVHSTMRTPSSLCPGLVLKTESKFGKKLDSMKTIGNKSQTGDQSM